MSDWSPWAWLILVMQFLCMLLLDGDSPVADEEVQEICEAYLALELPANSTYELVDISDTSKNVLTVLYCVLMTLALLGNLAVIVVFASNKHFRTVTNLFILSLAISDLLITAFCMPFNLAVILNRTWDFGNFSAAACKLMPYLQTLVVSASILTLGCISGERYLATIHPLKTKTVQTLPKTLIVISTVWLVAMSFAIPNAVWYELIEVSAASADDALAWYLLVVSSRHDSSVDTWSLCMVSDDDKDNFLVYKWVFFVVVFLLPLVAMSYCYAKVGHSLWVRKAIGSQSICNDRLRLRTSRRVVTMLVLILVLFVVCWGPILSFEIVALITSMEVTETTLNVKYYLQWLAMSNSCMNPFVYTFLHEKFKKSCSAMCRRRNNRKVAPAKQAESHMETNRSHPNYF